MVAQFPRTAEGFDENVIDRPTLKQTGLREGDDKGYRNVLVDDSREPLVELTEEMGLLLRPNYDGVDEITGEQDPRLILPGGTEGKMYARESAAISLKEFARYLKARYGEGVKPLILDAFRSYPRQAAGFSRKLMEGIGGNQRPGTAEFFNAGITADGTFSYVWPQFDSKEFTEFVNDLRGTADLMADLRLIAEERKEDVEATLMEFAVFWTNMRVAQQAGLEGTPDSPLNVDVPMNFENNAHAGGGAIDMFLAVDGKPASTLVPFDHMGEEAAIEYMEKESNLARFKKVAAKTPSIAGFLARLGMSAESLTMEQWLFARDANRIMHHAMKRVGATYYSGHKPKLGGENWHKEPGNQVWSIDGRQLIHSAASAAQYPNSGNPGHALQRMPKGQATAVWGGRFAHEQLGLI